MKKRVPLAYMIVGVFGLMNIATTQCLHIDIEATSTCSRTTKETMLCVAGVLTTNTFIAGIIAHCEAHRLGHVDKGLLDSNHVQQRQKMMSTWSSRLLIGSCVSALVLTPIFTYTLWNK